jgi:hypothetical protein
MRRGYPMKLLEEAATRIQSLNRDELLKEAAEGREKTEDNKVFLITTYNPNYQQLRRIVHDNWDMLGKSPATDFLYERRLMCGYRRPNNLRDFLVRANIPYKEGDNKARAGDTDPALGEENAAGSEEPTTLQWQQKLRGH